MNEQRTDILVIVRKISKIDLEIDTISISIYSYREEEKNMK